MGFQSVHIHLADLKREPWISACIPEYIFSIQYNYIAENWTYKFVIFNIKNSSEPYGFSFTPLHLIDGSDIDPASQFSDKQISQKYKPNGNPEGSQSRENMCCLKNKFCKVEFIHFSNWGCFILMQAAGNIRLSIT